MAVLDKDQNPQTAVKKEEPDSHHNQSEITQAQKDYECYCDLFSCEETIRLTSFGV